LFRIREGWIVLLAEASLFLYRESNPRVNKRPLLNGAGSSRFMNKPCWRRNTFVAIAALTALGWLALASGASDRASKPKLIVLVLFDQLRGDYPLRWHDNFGPDGFRRLERDGTWFTNCHYAYAGTQTGPGHASISTGCSPNRHGIVANDWFERSSGETVHCTTHARYQTVYSVPPPPEVKKPAAPDDDHAKEKEKDAKPFGAGCPDRLLVATFADALKEATGGRAKVVAASLKDRSAILLGGHKPDACYWFSSRAGAFATSTYYRDRPVAWVTTYNQSKPADRWFGSKWERLRCDLDYGAQAGPDDVAAEGIGVVKLQGRVFPHPMNAGLKEPGREYYDTLYTSPFGNELLLDFALRAIDEEKLGRGDVPDFLGISFPSNDPIGHVYGPDSQEVLDVTLRSDLILRDLMAALDRRVGAGNYVLAVSADHGVCPFPELSAARGLDAQRLDPKALVRDAPKHLNSIFGVTDEKAIWFEKEIFPWFYLNRKMIAARGLSEIAVADALADWLRKQPWALAVYTRQQLSGAPASLDPLGQSLQRSFHPDRSGDVAVVTKPYYLVYSTKTGTGHNSPHTYDTYVPLMVMGPGIPARRSDERVTPQAITAILAQTAGIPPLASADAPVPATLNR
jgi:Type I phosphodiesterase / nucleotide pyrophosphatase